MAVATDPRDCRRVAIHTLVRQLDNVIVAFHDLSAATTNATLSGRGGAGDFALLAHWTGAETPLRCFSVAGDAVLTDGHGAVVHLQQCHAGPSWLAV